MPWLADFNGNLGDSISLEDLAKRPGVTFDLIKQLVPELRNGDFNVRDLEAALADNLYAGYIKSQDLVNNRLRDHDGMLIPSNLDYKALDGLSREMVERLERSKATTFGDIRNISGLTPAALATVYVAVMSHR